LALVPVVLLNDRWIYEAYGRWVGGIVPLDWVAQFLTNVVVVKWVAVGSIVLVIADRRLRWWFLADVAMAMAAQASAVSLIKRLFGRLRPEAAGHLTIFQGPYAEHSAFGFPSGHAAAAFALAALLTAWYPRWRPAFIVAAILVCLARVQLERHFPADVLFGAWVGWVLGTSLVGWRQGRTRRRRSEPAAADPSTDGALPAQP